MAFHRIFVYGTLKRAQPNCEQLGPEYGIAKYIGQARTVKTWPLVIASRCNIPYLLDREGMGNHVIGEIYEVDEKMLQHCDIFEQCPDFYQRTTIQVQLVEDSTGSKVVGDSAQDVSVYILRGFKEYLLELPCYECYDSNGAHGLRYNLRHERSCDLLDFKSDVYLMTKTLSQSS